MPSSQSISAEDVQLLVDGDIAGHLAVGNHIIQIGSVHGGVVNFASPEQKPQVQSRPVPLQQRPRHFPGLLDRRTEVKIATSAFQSGEPVEIRGDAGIGKSVLLRYLAHQSATELFRDGIVHRSARNQPLADLLQLLFEDLFESIPPSIPTQAELRSALQSRQVLILLDNLELDRQELETLMDSASSSTFGWASRERRLWGEGRSVSLRGIPPEDAIDLVEREWGNPLSPDERSAAQAFCSALKGHPLDILEAVALALDEDESLAQVAQRLQTDVPSQALRQQVDASLTEREKRILEVLAVLKDVPVGVEHLAALTGLPDIEPTLETLQQRGIVTTNSPRYVLTGTLSQTLRQEQDLTTLAERALDYFTDWAEQHQHTPALVLEEADAIRQMLSWAFESERWSAVLQLGRAAEGSLALGRRWGAWDQVLRSMLQSAQELDDQAAEAWALHQRGTRALCLGDVEVAQNLLLNALRLREALGDKDGAAVTGHNLNSLQGPPSPPTPPSEPPSKPPTTLPVIPLPKAALLVILPIVLLALVSGGLVLARSPLGEFFKFNNETPIVQQSLTPTSGPTPTSTDILMPTDIPTNTPAPSDTPEQVTAASPIPTPITPTPISPTPTPLTPPTPPTSVTPPPVTPTIETGAPRGVIVCTGRLNMRTGPGTRYRVLGSLESGTEVNVLGKNNSIDGQLWYQIHSPSDDSVRTWVLGSCLAVQEDAVVRVPEVTPLPSALLVLQPLATVTVEPQPSPADGKGPPIKVKTDGCEHRGSAARPILEWTYDQPLAEDEFFKVTIEFWRPNETATWYDYQWIKEPRLEVPDYLYGLLPPNRDFKWTVAVARKTGVDEKGIPTGPNLTAASASVKCIWFTDPGKPSPGETDVPPGDPAPKPTTDNGAAPLI